jgi:hypothetical protein
MVSGREALTLTEVKIAALVARGDSTSDIARASRPSATAGRCIAAKVSSYDHYSRRRLAGSIEECPAPGTAKPRDGHSM